MLVATPKETPTMMPTTMSMAMLHGYAPKLHPQSIYYSDIAATVIIFHGKRININYTVIIILWPSPIRLMVYILYNIYTFINISINI